MVFVFAPMRANVEPSPGYLRYLRDLGGDVVLMPRALMADPQYWRDEGHLNKRGCQLMTEHFIRHEAARMSPTPVAD